MPEMGLKGILSNYKHLEYNKLNEILKYVIIFYLILRARVFCVNLYSLLTSQKTH